MCEGDLINHLPRRAQRVPSSRESRRYAIDQAPPVSIRNDGQWEPLDVIHKSMEHMFTFRSSDPLSCPPFLWKQGYLVAATNGGVMRCWDLIGLGHVPLPDLQPTSEIVLDRTSAGVVQILESKSITLPNTIFALSVEGTVFAIRGTTPQNLKIMHSWSATDRGATCMTILENGDIIIGFQSGTLEAWRFAPDGIRVDLVWKGYFDHRYPIRSVAQLKSNVPEEHANQELCVIVTFAPDQLTPTASMVEVLSLEPIVHAWSDSEGSAVPLVNCYILPRAGMELVDSSSASRQNGSIAAGQLTGSTPLVSLNHTNNIITAPPLVSTKEFAGAFALQDGTLAVVEVSATNSGTSWGIGQQWGQLLFSSSIIGVGLVNLPSNTDEERECTETFLVCCLRGASIFMVPLDCKESRRHTEKPQLVAPIYPRDLDESNGALHMQYFCAGAATFERDTISLLVLCWPGGLIEVFAPGLRRKANTEPLLTGLVENGSIQIFARILLNFDPHELPGDWKEALKQAKELSEDPSIQLHELQSERFYHFVNLLFTVTN